MAATAAKTTSMTATALVQKMDYETNLPANQARDVYSEDGDLAESYKMPRIPDIQW